MYQPGLVCPRLGQSGLKCPKLGTEYIHISKPASLFYARNMSLFCKTGKHQRWAKT